MYSPDDHTFALCAYRESAYLEDCIRSLKAQSIQSKIIVATATPNSHISELAAKYDIPLFTNTQPPRIATDWNYAIASANSPLVTIAHQDDVYCEDYTKRLLEAVNSVAEPILFFSNYGELRNNRLVNSNLLLNIKRFMLFPLRFSLFKNSRFIRRRILSFGSAICCPSVTMIFPKLETPLFNIEFSCNLDWQAWEKASKLRGAFLYDPEILMYHRIHVDSETTTLIKNNTRSIEDLAMLKQFWPRPIAVLINKLYSKSQQSNT